MGDLFADSITAQDIRGLLNRSARPAYTGDTAGWIAVVPTRQDETFIGLWPAAGLCGRGR